MLIKVTLLEAIYQILRCSLCDTKGFTQHTFSTHAVVSVCSIRFVLVSPAPVMVRTRSSCVSPESHCLCPLVSLWSLRFPSSRPVPSSLFLLPVCYSPACDESGLFRKLPPGLVKLTGHRTKPMAHTPQLVKTTYLTHHLHHPSGKT